MNMIFAHGAWDGEFEFSPLVAAVVGVTAAILIIVFLLRRRVNERRVSDGIHEHQASTPSKGNVNVQQASISEPSTADPGKTGTDASRASYAILMMLSEKGTPMEQSEIAESQGLPAEQVAAVLADLEKCELVERIWDRNRLVFRVRALI
jgi:hypothetical protein